MIAASKDDKEDTTLSHRQKQRAVKRVQKQEQKKIMMSGYQRGKKNNKQPKQPKKAYNSDSDDDDDESDEEQQEDEGQEVQGFTDDNNEWLKPKANGQNDESESDEVSEDDDGNDLEDGEENDSDDDEGESEGDSDEDGDEEQESEPEGHLKVQRLDELSDDESDDDDLFETDPEDDGEKSEADSDDDLLPIEKKSKKTQNKAGRRCEIGPRRSRNVVGRSRSVPISRRESRRSRKTDYTASGAATGERHHFGFVRFQEIPSAESLATGVHRFAAQRFVHVLQLQRILDGETHGNLLNQRADGIFGGVGGPAAADYSHE